MFSLPRCLGRAHSLLRSYSLPSHSVRLFSSSKDDDFLQNSIIPTYHYQNSLPRLPIPQLGDTCKRYLEFVEPLLTKPELENTTKLVNHFLEVDGPKLQEELVERDKKNKHTSYISEMWYDMYLEGRYPLPLNSNPFMGIRDFEGSRQTQLERAAALVRSSLRMWQSLSNERLAPETFAVGAPMSTAWQRVAAMTPSQLSYYVAYARNTYPLDMVQYSRLFGSTRLPHLQRDQLTVQPSPSHVAVLRGGHVFRLPALREDGRLRSTEELAADIAGILRHEQPSEFPVGMLTTLPRDDWFTLRKDLLDNDPEGHNRRALETIDDALFVLSLDAEKPSSPEESSRLFLHGDGSNRWFDKNFSLLVAGDGSAAVNFEHSWGDGVAVLRYLNEIYKDSADAPALPSITPNSQLKPMPWSLSDRVKKGVQQAQKDFTKTIGQLDLKTERFEDFGRNYLKERKISPDGVMQVAFQAAYHRLHNPPLPVSVYESASTAGFKHGRTETIRPVSNLSVAASKSLGSTTVTLEEQGKLIREAAKIQSTRAREALMGQGVDRHLFALNKLSKGVPDIFGDCSYSRLNHNILSTSTLSSPAIVGGGFGPVVADGYGVGYSSGDDFLGFNITSYQSRSEEFIKHLVQVLRDTRKALDAS